VSALFSSLYDHMPVYATEPSGAERAAAKVLLETAMGGTSRTDALPADLLEAIPVAPAGPIPSPRMPGPDERISA
jgi:hypothetical protein